MDIDNRVAQQGAYLGPRPDPIGDLNRDDLRGFDFVAEGLEGRLRFGIVGRDEQEMSDFFFRVGTYPSKIDTRVGHCPQDSAKDTRLVGRDNVEFDSLIDVVHLRFSFGKKLYQKRAPDDKKKLYFPLACL